MPTVDEQQLFDQPQSIPSLVAKKMLAVDQVPNPHWRPDACKACHTGTPSKQALKLREKDVDRLCNNCHEVAPAHSYIHPVGVAPTAKMKKRMPESFRHALKRGGGSLTCITCHDLPMQCLPKRAHERGLNPLFFRGGPYRMRTDLCFQCHDQSKYKRLNPHDQVSKAGKVRENLCLICHTDTANLQDARSIKDVKFVVRRDLASLCTRCHPWVPHPGGGFAFAGPEASNHLVVPPPSILARKRRMERINHVVLPLDPTTGRVFCATCHNPHAKGVVRNAAANKGAGSKNRLRMPNICINCHDKY